MRRTLCALLLLAALTGCGDDEARDGGGTTEPTADAAEPELVKIVDITAAGGAVSPRAYYVDDPEEMQAYVQTFEDRAGATAAVQQAVADAGEREGRLAIATIAIGCDVPPTASVTVTADGPQVRPGKIVDPLPECFAPVTSMALVEIPDAS